MPQALPIGKNSVKVRRFFYVPGLRNERKRDGIAAFFLCQAGISRENQRSFMMHDQSLIHRLLWLFKANVVISCLAVGGGYMIIPLMKKQFIDKARAFDFDELIEMYAIAQSAPGAIAVNLSAVTGYRIAGITGAVVSCTAAVLPPLVIISIAAACYQQFIHNAMINAALKGMIAAIAAIIIDVVLDMGKNVARARERLGLFTAAAVFTAAFVFNVSAILLIILSLAAYALLFSIKTRRTK